MHLVDGRNSCCRHDWLSLKRTAKKSYARGCQRSKDVILTTKVATNPNSHDEHASHLLRLSGKRLPQEKKEGEKFCNA